MLLKNARSTLYFLIELLLRLSMLLDGDSEEKLWHFSSDTLHFGARSVI